MRSLNFARILSLIVVAMALGMFVAGCGDDNSDGSETNPGAPAGATGSEAGGAAIEAGKVRDPKDVENEQKTYSEEPPPVNLQQGERSGYDVSKPTVVIARSNSDLKAMKKKIKASGVSTEIAPVDFKTRQAVLVQFPKLPGGTLTQITDIHEEDGKIVVSTVKLNPGEGCPKGKAGNPFSIVETRAMKGTTKLEIKTINNSACK